MCYYIYSTPFSSEESDRGDRETDEGGYSADSGDDTYSERARGGDSGNDYEAIPLAIIQVALGLESACDICNEPASTCEPHLRELRRHQAELGDVRDSQKHPQKVHQHIGPENPDSGVSVRSECGQQSSGQRSQVHHHGPLSRLALLSHSPHPTPRHSVLRQSATSWLDTHLVQ